jgi:hypothetical protein
VATLRAARKPVDDFKNLRQEVLDLEKSDRELRQQVADLKKKLDTVQTAPGAPASSKKPKASSPKTTDN